MTKLIYHYSAQIYAAIVLLIYANHWYHSLVLPLLLKLISLMNAHPTQ